MRVCGAHACLVVGLLFCACSDGERIGTSWAALSVPSDCPTIDMDAEAPDPSQIALTFDDGPESSGTTAQVLDVLKTAGVKATFFINTNDSIDVLASTAARATIQRMVSEGHQIGDHTVHHYDLALTSTDVASELSGVVDVLRAVAPNALFHRLVRAPFGSPYFGPQDRLDVVAPIVGRYGVHVGWTIDSRDWACTSATDPVACVKTNVLTLVDAGHSGVVLLHSTQAQTVAALPDLITALRSRGKTFIQVEQLVLAKYGKTSRRLFRCSSNADCWTGDVCAADGHCAAAPVDAGPPDTGVADTGTRDTGIADSGIPDTRTGGAGIVDSGIADTGTKDTGAFDAGSNDTSSPDTSSIVDSLPDSDAPDAGVDGSVLTLDPSSEIVQRQDPIVTPDAGSGSDQSPLVGSCHHGRATGGAWTSLLFALVWWSRRRRK